MSMIDELRKQHLCKGLSEDLLNRLSTIATFQIVEREQVIAEENSPAEHFYIIIKGSVKITKNTSTEAGAPQHHVLAELQAGELLGEMALIDDQPRSATVTAKGASVLIKFDNLKIQQDIELLSALTANIATDLSQRLRYTNKVTLKNMSDKLKEARARITLGVFILATLWLVSLYSLAIASLNALAPTSPYVPVISFFIMLLIATGLFLSIKKTALPIAFFGVHRADCRRQLIEAALISLPIILVLILLKALYLFATGHGSIDAILQPYAMFNQQGHENVSHYWLTLLAYICLVPLQEFIVRGTLQTSFQRFLHHQGRLQTFNAIVLSNLIFSMSQASVSLTFALISFVPGLLFGYLYNRQQSLVGVVAAHLILGVFLFFIMGIPANVLYFPHM